MSCDSCGGDNATLQYTEVMGASKKVQWFCQGCAEARGLLAWQAEAASAQEDAASGVLGTIVVEQTSTIRLAPGRRCDACGMRLSDLRNTGRVGCPQCYETFREHLEPLLRRVHGATEHRGHGPGAAQDREHVQHELARLRRELLDAVRREDYEQAARVRDEIARRETELAQGGAKRP